MLGAMDVRSIEIGKEERRVRMIMNWRLKWADIEVYIHFTVLT